MASAHPIGFTAHNVRLDDGTFTFPEAATIDQTPDYLCVRKFLPILYPQGWAGRSIVDLGSLEGGFAVEFARLGLVSTGIDVRESNIANAEYIRARTNLPDLRFICDDARNVGRHGPFDLVFCVGLHYHIEDQRSFLQEMGKACRAAIFIDTHFAPEMDDHPAVALHALSELTTHEGLPGRWYPEHDLEAGADRARLEAMKWASWDNRRSFWPTRGALVHAMYDAGFTTVVEDFDQHMGGAVHQLSPDGWYEQNCRAMFVGFKAEDGAGPRPFDQPGHALDGRPRPGFWPPPPPPPPPPAPPIPVAELEEIARLRQALDAVQASTSWRVTAPLRRLKGLFGG